MKWAATLAGILLLTNGCVTPQPGAQTETDIEILACGPMAHVKTSHGLEYCAAHELALTLTPGMGGNTVYDIFGLPDETGVKGTNYVWHYLWAQGTNHKTFEVAFTKFPMTVTAWAWFKEN